MPMRKKKVTQTDLQSDKHRKQDFSAPDVHTRYEPGRGVNHAHQVIMDNTQDGLQNTGDHRPERGDSSS